MIPQNRPEGQTYDTLKNNSYFVNKKNKKQKTAKKLILKPEHPTLKDKCV